MKVKFNLPKKSFNSKLSFDSNTTFGFGNVQPLFCKFVVPHSKLNINFGQLTRLAPLVVPSFARLKQLNDFVFVPMNKVFPAFDAFLSRNMIKGTESEYIPDSVPCISNHRLFNLLVTNYSYSVIKFKGAASFVACNNTVLISDSLFGTVKFSNQTFNLPSDVSKETWDYHFMDGTSEFYSRLTQDGRYWFTILKGLGYSLDPSDDKPVSVLPLLAFIKAYYDLYYVKRYNSWHSSTIYSQINAFYNGKFTKKTIDGHNYDLFNSDVLCSLFDASKHDFYLYASSDSSPLQVALSDPLNTSYEGLSQSSPVVAFKSSLGGQDVIASNDLVGSTPQLKQENGVSIAADSLSLVDRLWHFMSRSSVVGQSVKDWFKVHFGVNPSEDMFETCTLFASKPNMININAVIATADGSNGTTSSRLGDLGGQAFASAQDKVSFDCNTFGFVFCISSIIPLSRVSGGTQPELYNTSYFDFPFPDFDGLGYEVVNQSSLGESGFKGDFAGSSKGFLNKGFGWLPRLSSYKFLNNFRSGGFALPSVMDSYLSYCEDTVLDNRANDLSPVASPTNLKLNFPWRYGLSNFVSYDRIFYNQFTPSPHFIGFIDDNFMSQSSFEITVTSYLKPLSDSYSIEELGNRLISAKAQ